MTNSRTDRVLADAADHLLSPYQGFDADPTAMLAMESGAGITLVDTSGRTYLDAIGGMWCTNIGTGREEMAEAIADQVRKLSFANPFTDMLGVPAAELAATLTQLTPANLNHVFFTTGGSTAVDAAFRLVQFYNGCLGRPDKRHVISREDAYHGSTYAAVSIGGKKSDHMPEFQYIEDTVHHLSSPNFYRHGGDRTEAEFADDLVAEFDALVDRIGSDSIAAFFAEPIMGSGGVVPPPANYLHRVWQRCRELDILYVSDEVVTGFGRLGEWFCSESMFDIQPDIITSAKGLTSGYLPLGAMIYSDQIHDVISQRGHQRYFGVGFTYSGHPVSCAAALKNIEIIERENLLGHVRTVGPYFMERLNELRDMPLVGDVRGSHLMACVEFEMSAIPADYDIGKAVAEAAQARGLIVRPIGNLNVMSPALVITAPEIDQIVERLRTAIESIDSA